MLENDAPHPLRTLTRRDVMVAGAALGGTVAAASVAMATVGGSPWTAGTVHSVGSGELVLRPADGSPLLRVRLGAGAVVLKDAPASIEEFVPGEEVAVLGERGERGDVVATRLESTYRLVEGVVTDREGDRLVAGGTRLELSGDSRSDASASSLERVGRGDQVIARGLLNPDSGAIEVAVIGVVD
jgi:hypothetical protein